MNVLSNYMVLREENFQASEIKINVGKEGSMQIGENSTNGNYLFYCPAVILDKEIQVSIIQCINEAIQKYEENNLDPIALLQTKARTHFVKNKSIIRNRIKNRI